MQLQHAIEAFADQLKARGRSPKTVYGYTKELKRFSVFVARQINADVYVSDITLTLIDAYQRDQTERGLEPPSRYSFVNAIRTFFKFATKRGIAQVDLGAQTDTVFIPKKERQALSDAEVETLKSKITRPLLKTLFLTLLNTGLRISEALELKTADIDFEENLLRVKHGKGNKYRIIPLNSFISGVLRDYLASRRLPKESPYVFSTATGRLSTQYTGELFKQLRKASGLNRSFSPHILRHTFACRLLKSGANLVNVQRLLGHTSLNTTGIYLHTDVSELRSSVNNLVQ